MDLTSIESIQVKALHGNEYREFNELLVTGILAFNPCQICGEKDLACLDFHHIEPEKKEFTISQHMDIDTDILYNELTKCTVLCANCHRKLHASERTSSYKLRSLERLITLPWKKL